MHDLGIKDFADSQPVGESLSSVIKHVRRLVSPREDIDGVASTAPVAPNLTLDIAAGGLPCLLHLPFNVRLVISSKTFTIACAFFPVFLLPLPCIFLTSFLNP